MTTAEPFTIPVRVVSEANRREHWRTRHRRQKEQETATLAVLTQFKLEPYERRFTFADGATITLTKVGGGKLDSDNLAGAFKKVRDTIARWMAIDDGDDRLT